MTLYTAPLLLPQVSQVCGAIKHHRHCTDAVFRV